MKIKLPTLRATLYALIVKTLGVDLTQVTPEATFESLGADSLDRIDLVMNIEDEFDIDVPDAISEAWETVGDAEAYLASLA